MSFAVDHDARRLHSGLCKAGLPEVDAQAGFALLAHSGYATAECFAAATKRDLLRGLGGDCPECKARTSECAAALEWLARLDQ